MRLLGSVLFLATAANAFVAPPPFGSCASTSVNVLAATAQDSKSSSPAMSEAERLLQKARELRAKAEEAEQQVHKDLAKKKAKTDKHTDELIECIFFSKEGGVADRLRAKHLSMDTMEQIVDRLYEREVIAEGNEHVQTTIDPNTGEVTCQRVAQRNEAELERLQGLLDMLIDGVKVLDEEFLQQKQSKKETYVTHTEDQHWGAGNRASRLLNRSKEIRRERDEQFQKRLEEFREAQRVKKDRPPPPKVKDDHGLVP